MGHSFEAEKLLGYALDSDGTPFDEDTHSGVSNALLAAQVHATLTLAEEVRKLTATDEPRVWWFDDGGDNPVPELHETYLGACEAGRLRWEADNPFTLPMAPHWETADGKPLTLDSDTQLVVDGQPTGLFVRPITPKRDEDGA